MFIPNSKLQRFKREITKLNKKLAKYDSEITVKYLGETSIYVTLMEDEVMVVDAEHLGLRYKVTGQEVQVDFPEVTGKEGVEFLGTIEGNEDSGYTVWTPQNSQRTDLYKLAYMNDDKVCHHCNIRRDRKKYFYFLENNEVKKVGSTCVQEWFGLPLESILYNYQTTTAIITSLEEDFDFGFVSDASDFGITLDDLIKVVSFVTDGFLLSWQSQGATSNMVRDNLRRAKDIENYFVDKRVVKDNEGVDVKQEIINTWNIQANTDFEFNIVHTLFDTERELVEYIPFNKLGIASWAIYASVTGYKRRQVEDPLAHLNHLEYAGDVGSKVVFTAKPERVASFDTQWGYSFVYIFRQGNYIFKWVTSKDLDEDVEYTLRGTVKAHDVYGGEKQTVVTRCKEV